MKKYVYLLLGFFIGIKASAQTSDTTLNQLLAINEGYYINKPVDSLLSVLPGNYTRMIVRGIRGTARFILVNYANNVWIELHVRQFTHMPPYDTARNWNIALMREENLDHIVIYKGQVCYKNCPF